MEYTTHVDKTREENAKQRYVYIVQLLAHYKRL